MWFIPKLIPPSVYRWNALAEYNAEVCRGIVHTPEWVAKMADEQRQFNILRFGYATVAELQAATGINGGGFIVKPPDSAVG